MKNTDENILNKTLAKQIQHIKKKYTTIKLESSQGHKDGSTYANQSRCYIYHINKSHMIISTDAKKKKAFDKIQHPFMIKTPTKVGSEGIYRNIIRAIYDKPIINIILSSENLKAFPLKQETR